MLCDILRVFVERRSAVAVIASTAAADALERVGRHPTARSTLRVGEFHLEDVFDHRLTAALRARECARVDALFGIHFGAPLVAVKADEDGHRRGRVADTLRLLAQLLFFLYDAAFAEGAPGALPAAGDRFGTDGTERVAFGQS